MGKVYYALAIIGAGLFVSAAERDQIVIPDRPTAVERTAAKELQTALKRITSDTYVIVAETDASADRAVYAVGATERASRLAATSGWGEPAYDEIRRGTVDGCVVLDGHAQRGAIYAVDAFLEDVAGVRWWTAGESDYPEKPGWRPEALPPYRYAPPFRFRETFYRSTLTDVDFKVRAKVNTTSYTRFILPPAEERFVPPEKGDNHKLVFFKPRRSAYHSFFQVLPPEKYAKDHPDWYSEVDGKRTGGGQLCVTNPEMLKEYVRNTLELLRASPDCDAIQVSQNDVGEASVCRCATCRAAMEAEGAWSGPYITFANKVAEAIEPEFPHVTVDTFAYMFTRKAPKTVRPRHNVVVRLCDIECAFNRPLADPTYAANRTFLNDLRDWSRVASGNLYLWDYQANFLSYMMPHPNLQVFADNIRLFRDAGAVGVFEQGDAMCPAGDFCALKCYVTAHLMWDPSKDWKALTDEFLVGYYGAAAAPHLKRVLEVSAASASRTDAPPMGCYHSDPQPWITSEVARTALAEMDAALAAAEKAGPVFARRVRFAKLSWDHAKIRAWGFWDLPGRPESAVAEFRQAIAAFGIDAYRETNEHRTLVDYLAGGLSAFEHGCDWVKSFNVDGRDIAVGANHQLDFAKLYPDDVPKEGVGKRFAEATAVVDVERGGERTLFLYMDWFGEISVNGGPVVKLNGACENQDARQHKVTLKPGRNEIAIRVRAGGDGRWYLALGVSRSDAAAGSGAMSERQQALVDKVDRHATSVLEAERWLWAHPQTGFTEWQAHAYLTNRFAALGYTLTCAGNIPGFYADVETGHPGPKVCVLAELDALDIPGHPEAVDGIAHLCGHHAQCAALLGLAAALKEPGALDGLSGSVRLMLVPSEELVQVSFRDELRAKGTIRSFGGKPEFMRRGFFDDVDLAMNVHQGSPDRNIVFDAIRGCNGCLVKKFVFKGKTAHAAANPSDGVNAQYAATLALQACNDLRETFREGDRLRWHPVLRGADCAVNNIPDSVLVEACLRGNSMAALKRENAKINRAVAGAALAMGARVELHDRPGYAPGEFDVNFLKLMEQSCVDMVGREKVAFHYSAYGSGSTDMSDLACVMPTAWFNVNGGFTGCGHRVDYRIVDPRRLCVDSAKAQILVIDALLKEEAAAAKEIKARFKPRYPSIKAYLEAADAFFLDQEAVTYDTNGRGTVKYW